MGPAGLAIGTAVGAWINFALLVYLARRRSLSEPDDRLYENIALMGFAAAGAALATPALLRVADWIGRGLPILRQEFVVVATFGALSLAYFALFAGATALFGRGMRRQLF
jgi:peptidoglycan biosynthesis protein MviN/MurJ (putative lipid II flippase)